MDFLSSCSQFATWRLQKLFCCVQFTSKIFLAPFPPKTFYVDIEKAPKNTHSRVLGEALKNIDFLAWWSETQLKDSWFSSLVAIFKFNSNFDRK